MIRDIVSFIIIFSSSFINGYSQNPPKKLGLPLGQDTIFLQGIKTNIVYDLTSTLNLGAELQLSKKLSLDISLNYNPWTFSNNRKLKHFLIQPELRSWLNDSFKGHFLGAHLIYIHYNVGNLPFGSLDDHRYQGDAYGIGFSYGYQWTLSPIWNIEATLGLGYMYLDYTRYECETCGSELGKSSKNYIGPTKIGLSLIYILK
ncbi:MAG: DUF3575 domain-containing protein [Dysgonomonas sp.]